MGGYMKNSTISLLILCTSFPLAAQSPADYPQKLHVTSSHLIFDPSGKNRAPSLQIDAVVNGKRYVLLGSAPVAAHNVRGFHPSTLPVGDYRAKSISGDHKSDNLFSLGYEILLSGGNTAKFDVVGEGD
jgi:hypothetical protein